MKIFVIKPEKIQLLNRKSKKVNYFKLLLLCSLFLAYIATFCFLLNLTMYIIEDTLFYLYTHRIK